MPEGPNLIMTKENLLQFKGRRVTAASGYAKNVDPDMLKGNTLKDIKTWGKHLLLVFEDFTLRVHFGLFGSFRIDRPVKKNAALHLQFGEDEVNFSIVKIQVIDEPLDKVYDWSADIMSKKWDERKAIEKLKAKPKLMICDALLDQNIFAGSGNIIKNEALFRARIHPESLCGEIPDDKLKELSREVIAFSKEFLKYGKTHHLGERLEAYNEEMCPRNHIPFHKKDTGKTKRRTFYCDKCQVLYE
ncbi:MAG TPA: DNA-formamidopyrimidine glycosylase family protein [Mucilaginibacter sp.]|nr:DNA-formamidopyrimidine glycosylase family protein [Mucilaginibacter sp.]